MTSPIAKLGIVGLGASPAPLDIAVNVALPAITDHFALALGDVQWLVVCYVLVYGSLMLVCGKMGDLVGHRLIFRTGLLVTAVGCAACAIAPNWPLFLLARTVQGVGTALALSCTPALATAVYPPEQRVKALAGYAMAMSLAAALRPVLGGILVAMWDWQAVYWVRVPIALLALTLSGALPSAHAQSRHFDLSGAILLAAFMGTLLLALVLSQRPAVSGWIALGLLAVALALLHRYVKRSLNSAEPIIRPELFADAAFTIPERDERTSKSGGLCHPAANAILPHERTASLSHYQRIHAGACLHRHARRGASGGATGPLVRAAADSLCRHRARGSRPPAAWAYGRRSCRSHGGVSACTRRSGARIAQRRLH
jgi:hypothetical protein